MKKFANNWTNISWLAKTGAPKVCDRRGDRIDAPSYIRGSENRKLLPGVLWWAKITGNRSVSDRVSNWRFGFGQAEWKDGSSYRLGFLASGTFLFLCGQFHDAALYNWEGVHDAGNRRPETAVITGKNSVIERTPWVHLCTPSELGSRKGSQGRKGWGICCERMGQNGHGQGTGLE